MLKVVHINNRSGMDDLSDEESSDDEETEEHRTENTSDNGKTILTNSLPQPKKTDTDLSEKGADDETREDGCVVNDNQEVVENGSISSPTETENVATDKDKSSSVAEGKDAAHEDCKTISPLSQNDTSPTANDEKGTVEKSTEVTYEVCS